jgi:hypothetical protein
MILHGRGYSREITLGVNIDCDVIRVRDKLSPPKINNITAIFIPYTARIEKEKGYLT